MRFVATEEWKLLCVVMGYHAFKDVWDPALEDQFRTNNQKHNSHDKYAMAVVPVNTPASRAGRSLGLPAGHFVIFSVTLSFSRSLMVRYKTNK